MIVMAVQMPAPEHTAGLRSTTIGQDDKKERIVDMRVTKVRASSGAYWMLAVVTILYVASMIDRQVIGLLIPSIKKEFGVTDIQVSLASGAAFATFYCLVGLPIGYAVDRFSRRIIIFVGVFIWGLATMGCGLAGSFSQLAMARFMVGAGEAALSPSAYSLFGDSFPRHRLGFATAIFGVGATFGTAIAYGFGAEVLAALPHAGIHSPIGPLTPWRATFVLAALPALLILPLVFTFREPKRAQRTRRAPLTEGLSLAWRHRRFFLPYFLSYGMLLAGAWAFSIWVPTVYHRRFGVSMETAGSVLGILSAVGAVTGALIFGTISDRLTKRGHTDAPMRTFAILAGGIGIVGLGFALAPTYPWAIVAGLLLFVFSGLPALASAIPMVCPPHLRGQISALYLMVGNLLGMALGPTIAALFTDKLFHDENMVHWSVALTLMVVGPIACFLLLAARKPMRDVVAITERYLASDQVATPVG